MIDLKQYEVWFVTGSQHLYGPKTLEEVAAHSKEIAAALGASKEIPVQMVFKPVLTTCYEYRISEYRRECRYACRGDQAILQVAG